MANRFPDSSGVSYEIIAKFLVINRRLLRSPAFIPPTVFYKQEALSSYEDSMKPESILDEIPNKESLM